MKQQIKNIMRNIIVALVITLSLNCFSQTIEKEFGEFSQLKTFDGLSVELVASDTNRAVISGEYKEDVVFVNKNGLLKIRFNIPKVSTQYKTKVVLYYKSLYLIDANEGSFIFTDGTVKEMDLDIKVQEGAIIRLDVEAQRVNSRMVSGGIITLSGKTKNQDVVVNTGGVFKGKECITDQTKVTVSAGGSADVYATEIVKANVKAGGSIMIYGNPKLADTKKVFGGTIKVVK
jgi:hypothetical protein